MTSVHTTTDERAIENPEDSSLVSDGEDASIYPPFVILVVIMIGLFLGTLLMALDTMIITTPLPTITEEFHSLEDVGWYGSAYLLTLTVFQPSYGKVYRLFQPKLAYLTSIFVFEVGSVVCAIAKNSNTFIAGRAIAGLGAAGIMQGGLCIIAFNVPSQKRPIYISILISVYGMAGVSGPLIGGVITDRWSWRGCFWINLPIGFITVIAITLYLKASTGNVEIQKASLGEKLKQFDFPGSFLLITAASCLLLVLQWGGITKPFNSPTIIGLLCTFAVLTCAFVASQIYFDERATIPPRYMKIRNILIGSMYLFFLYMPMQTHAYYLPFYFQAVQGTSASTSGIRYIPTPMALMAGTVLSGVLASRFSCYYLLIVLGSAIFCVGAGLLYTLDVGSSAAKWAGYQVIAGFGLGSAMQIPMSMIHTVLKPAEIATGNAVLVFCGQLGGAIAISIAQNIFTSTIKLELPLLSGGAIDPNLVIQAGATQARRLAPPGKLQDALIKAYAVAIRHTFLFAVVGTAVALLCALFVERQWRKIVRDEIDITGIDKSADKKHDVKTSLHDSK